MKLVKTSVTLAELHEGIDAAVIELNGTVYGDFLDPNAPTFEAEFERLAAPARELFNALFDDRGEVTLEQLREELRKHDIAKTAIEQVIYEAEHELPAPEIARRVTR